MCSYRYYTFSSCMRKVKVKVAQSCPTLCDPHGLYSPWNSPGQNARVGSLSLLQEIFPGLPHCRRILYQLSHQGSPRILEWVACPFSSGSSRPRDRTGSPALQVDSLPTELWGKPVEMLANMIRKVFNKSIIGLALWCLCHGHRIRLRSAYTKRCMEQKHLQVSFPWTDQMGQTLKMQKPASLVKGPAQHS